MYAWLFRVTAVVSGGSGPRCSARCWCRVPGGPSGDRRRGLVTEPIRSYALVGAIDAHLFVNNSLAG